MAKDGAGVIALRRIREAVGDMFRMSWPYDMICCAVEHMVNQRYDNEKGLWNLRRRAKANESDFLPRYFLKHRSKVFYFSLYLLFFLCRILFINGIFLKIEKSIRKVKGLSRAIINGVSSYEREQHSVSMYTI